MLAIAIIIGLCALAYRKYAEVAFEFHRSRVGFGFAGVGFFLAANFLFQFVAGIVIGFSSPDMLGDMAAILIITIISYVAGIMIALWILKAFKKSWRRQRDSNDQILDR